MEILESCSGRIPEMDTQNGRVCKTWGKKNLNIRHVRNSFFYLIISLSAGCKNLFCFNNQPVREGFHLQSGTVGKRWYLDAVFSHLMYHYVFHQARARPQIVKESRHSGRLTLLQSSVNLRHPVNPLCQLGGKCLSLHSPCPIST